MLSTQSFDALLRTMANRSPKPAQQLKQVRVTDHQYEEILTFFRDVDRDAPFQKVFNEFLTEALRHAKIARNNGSFHLNPPQTPNAKRAMRSRKRRKAQHGDPSTVESTSASVPAESAKPVSVSKSALSGRGHASREARKKSAHLNEVTGALASTPTSASTVSSTT